MDLFLHGRRARSVFDLLGDGENDITAASGWALANAPTFRARLAEAMGAPPDAFDAVRLQEYDPKDGGYTDLELIGPAHHAILEAKRGWWLPGDHQLQRYVGRLQAPWRRLAALSDCTAAYAALSLPKTVAGVDVAYFGWRDLEAMARGGATHAEKRLLAELRTYLRTVATMQNPTFNLAYVVSLNAGTATGADVPWIDIVVKQARYFHPVGKGWPKEPPNYVAFRYHGRLQSVHHIESFEVTTDLAARVPGWNLPTPGPHYLYALGPAIRPLHEMKTGPKVVRSNRVWAMLDLLLTAPTLTEAVRLTKLRLATDGADDGLDLRA